MTDEEAYQELVFDKQEDDEYLEKLNQEDYDDYEPDAHCCSMHQDEEGYCEICGAAVPGTWAYYEQYGGN